MSTAEALHQFDDLVMHVRPLLEKGDPDMCARAIQALALGVQALEHTLVQEVHEQGASWAEIGSAFGISRQAAHQRFSPSKTVVSADFFDSLFAEDVDDEPIPALREARALADEIVKNPLGVSD